MDVIRADQDQNFKDQFIQCRPDVLSVNRALPDCGAAIEHILIQYKRRVTAGSGEPFACSALPDNSVHRFVHIDR